MSRAYLDHASTTPARPEALAALTRWMTLPPGDPGRLHEEGRIVRDAVEEAREQVAALVSVTPREVVFTSGGTEAINAAVWGATRAAPGLPVLCAAVEHSAVRDASARLAPTEDVPVDRTGRLEVEALRERLRSSSLPRPALVHCQWGNHEVGTLQPVHEVVALCHEAGVTVHVDAAAACGHVPLDLAALEPNLAVVAYYGFPVPQATIASPPPAPLSVAAQMSGSILALWGDEDSAVGMENVAAFVEAMRDSPAQFDHRVYSGLGHAFLGQADLDDPDADDASASWRLAVDHLVRELLTAQA